MPEYMDADAHAKSTRRFTYTLTDQQLDSRLADEKSHTKLRSGWRGPNARSMVQFYLVGRWANGMQWAMIGVSA